MNVEIGTKAAKFPEKEYINGIFVVVLRRNSSAPGIGNPWQFAYNFIIWTPSHRAHSTFENSVQVSSLVFLLLSDLTLPPFQSTNVRICTETSGKGLANWGLVWPWSAMETQRGGMCLLKYWPPSMTLFWVSFYITATGIARNSQLSNPNGIRRYITA